MPSRPAIRDLRNSRNVLRRVVAGQELTRMEEICITAHYYNEDYARYVFAEKFFRNWEDATIWAKSLKVTELPYQVKLSW